MTFEPINDEDPRYSEIRAIYLKIVEDRPGLMDHAEEMADYLKDPCDRAIWVLEKYEELENKAEDWLTDDQRSDLVSEIMEGFGV